jgi:hypothetical protein
MNQRYQSTVARNVYELLQLLLMYGKDLFPLIKVFIMHNKLDLNKVRNGSSDH